MRKSSLALISLTIVLLSIFILELTSSHILFLVDSNNKSSTFEIVSRIHDRYFAPPYRMAAQNRDRGEPSKIIRGDPTLGYTYHPGAHTVRLEGRKETYAFDLTVNAQGHRLTSFSPVHADRTVYVMGDSVASGWINDDALSFPFLLQTRLPEWRIMNLAVPGYGPVQAYLQARSLTETLAKADAILLTHADYFPARAVGEAAYLSNLRRAPAVAGVEDAEAFRALLLPVARRLDTRGHPVIDYVPVAEDSNAAFSPISAEQKNAILAGLYAGVRAAAPDSAVILLYTQGEAGPETLDLFNKLRRAGILVCDGRPGSRLEKDDYLPLDGHPGPKTQNWFAKVADTALRTGQCASPG
jgi:hypothetical protein